MEATEGFLEKIRPPRIEDAGLEDCALPPESIHEAFLKAASAVRSRATSILSHSDDEPDATCVDDPWPRTGDSTDKLVGISAGTSPPGGCAGRKGSDVPEVTGDKVVAGPIDDEVERGDRVVGADVPKEGESCVDELQGLKIRGEKKKSEDGDDDKKSDDRPILTEGVGKKMMVLRLIASGCLLVASVIVSAERSLKQETVNYSQKTEPMAETNYLVTVVNFLWQEGKQGYVHVWPEIKFGWRIIVGSIIGFLGAALGSVGGVGGGGIYVPMLTLIIGFDAKSSTALSKCMITGAAGATVYYNLKLRHPTLNLPIIDYDLALLFQPMLVLGISIGVTLNVMFADWMVTVLLIVLFIGTSTKAFLKGAETWKLETMAKKEALKHLASNDIECKGEVVAYQPLPGGPIRNASGESNESKTSEISLFDNIYWKKLGILVAVWIIILVLQLAKNHMEPCSLPYWVWNLLQIPVAIGASGYEAVSLYSGRSVIASKGEAGTNLKWHQLVMYCCYGIVAGMVGGLLGLGGGFILGPLLLELGIPPQVSSATATFAMTFSASMSVIEYYLLKRFPIPYALYFVAVAMVAALTGQHVVRKIINFLGRASLIIFILGFTIFVSAISLGGVGIVDMVERMERKEYMGFENICEYRS